MMYLQVEENLCFCVCMNGFVEAFIYFSAGIRLSFLKISVVWNRLNKLITEK